MKRPTQTLEDELLNEQWMHTYSCAGLSIQKVAKRHNCSIDDVRRAMSEIEKSNPKSERTWKRIEFKKPCRTCGKVIGFARTENDKLMPVNLDDYTTHWSCEKPAKAR